MFDLCSANHRYLLSFPTRRSSDLQSYGRVGASKPKPVSMSSIVQDVSRSVTGMASQNGVQLDCEIAEEELIVLGDRKSTRLNSSHRTMSYAVFCLKKKKT